MKRGAPSKRQAKLSRKDLEQAARPKAGERKLRVLQRAFKHVHHARVLRGHRTMLDQLQPEADQIRRDCEMLIRHGVPYDGVVRIMHKLNDGLEYKAREYFRLSGEVSRLTENAEKVRLALGGKQERIERRAKEIMKASPGITRDALRTQLRTEFQDVDRTTIWRAMLQL